jgi:hypothetical protein
MHSRNLLGAAIKSASIAALILIFSIALVISATPARAQDDSSQNSDSGYQDEQVAPNTDMSDPDSGDDGQSVRVPIPGGGDVTADGPGSDQQEPPGQNWSTDSLQPNSVGGGAADPQ